MMSNGCTHAQAAAARAANAFNFSTSPLKPNAFAHQFSTGLRFSGFIVVGSKLKTFNQYKTQMYTRHKKTRLLSFCSFHRIHSRSHRHTSKKNTDRGSFQTAFLFHFNPASIRGCVVCAIPPLTPRLLWVTSLLPPHAPQLQLKLAPPSSSSSSSSSSVTMLHAPTAAAGTRVGAASNVLPAPSVFRRGAHASLAARTLDSVVATPPLPPLSGMPPF